MRNATHELIGVTAAVAAAKTAQWGAIETTATAAAACCGSWLPDADRLGSRIHRRTRLERSSLAGAAVGAVLRLPLLAFGALGSHRGASHSALACVAAGGAVGVALAPLGAAAAQVLATGVTLGYGAHVLADACTPAGVALWWPLSRRRIWVLPPGRRIRTGSTRELLIAALVGAAAVTLLVAG